MAIGGELRMRVTVNPGRLASEVMKKGLYDAYIDSLLDVAQEFQEKSPIGATRQLVEGWSITSPRKESVTFDINASIVNTSDRAINRISGRPPGAPPPISPLQDWVIAKGIERDPKKARGVAFAIRRKIMNEGTERYKHKENWVGIDYKGKRIPGGRLEQAEKEIAAKLKALNRG